MTEEMMKEILESWTNWKYDIIDINKEDWTQRDQSKVDTITTILENELKVQKALNRR
jgi:hypothetical protein